MVISLRLAARQDLDPAVETMGRAWFGFDPALSDEALWTQNRGRYAFDMARIETERYATLSFRGQVLVVVELRDPIWEPFEDLKRGITKQALIGDVLGPGDPVYDLLIRQTIQGGRGAFTYLDDEEIGLTGALAGTDGTDGTDPRGAGGRPVSAQGWESDAALRKQVEDAAQDRLMALYRDDGWEVVDTRHSRPFDALARRGDEVAYLEAEGTRTAGAAVLVTRGEIDHAHDHLGQCVMGRPLRHPARRRRPRRPRLGHVPRLAVRALGGRPGSHDVPVGVAGGVKAGPVGVPRVVAGPDRPDRVRLHRTSERLSVMGPAPRAG